MFSGVICNAEKFSPVVVRKCLERIERASSVSVQTGVGSSFVELNNRRLSAKYERDMESLVKLSDSLNF